MKRLGFLAFGLAVWLSACSLAGDVTPPPGANLQRPATGSSGGVPALPDTSTIDVSNAAPASRPSAAAGSAIYAARCAECHGVTGESDGARVAQLPAAPPKLAAAETLRGFTPRDLYGVVTLGRIENFMPPFAEALTDAQRWDVVAYLYTLSSAQTQIDEGQLLYAQNCADCHGSDGAKLRDWTQPVYFATTSPMQMFEAIGAGLPEVEGHAFADKLSEAERWAVVDFARTLTYDYFAPGEPLPEQTGEVLGMVVNGTAGGSVPADLAVTLIGFTDTSLSETLTTTVQTDGQFTFAGVSFTAGEQFILTSDYRGITYHSDVFSFEGGQASQQQALTIYEVTDSAANVRIEQLHTFMMFDSPGQVTVGQMAILSNDGDAAFAPPDGKTVKLAVPPGATDVVAPDGVEGETYFVTPEGYVDARPIPPGEGTLQVFYQYRLPYPNQLDFEQPLDYPASSANLFLGDAGIAVNGAGLQNLGQRNMQGLVFQQFQRTGLNAGDVLAFQLDGAVSAGEAASAAPTFSISSDSALTLGVGLGAVVALLGGIALWWFRRPGRVAPARANGHVSREDLLQALAELDDDYDAGRVAAPEYERERAWLKSQVKRVWQRDG